MSDGIVREEACALDEEVRNNRNMVKLGTVKTGNLGTKLLWNLHQIQDLGEYLCRFGEQ
ncbi:hypothetical protein [Ruegeria sp. THAF57]|uniref:hypothetical protein n=1 Tax=Ruegeria sp. THAF57 TaxID=2744555 RepID=UPI0015DE5E8C|nr:hypothetical protein [Ruegeria sp. THAF57]